MADDDLKLVPVPLGDRAYDILIGARLLDGAGARLAERFPGRRFGIVTDTEVARAQLPRLVRSLDAAGLGHAEIVLPNGEATKSVGRLNEVYRANSALWRHDTEPRGFEWLEAGDAQHNVLAFLRWSEDGPVVAAFNFSGAPHGGYRIALPFAGSWDEILNTDAVEFGGSGVGNSGRVAAEDRAWNGRAASVELNLPPLGAVFLRPTPPEPIEVAAAEPA